MKADQMPQEIKRYIYLTDTFFRKSIQASPVPIMLHGEDGEIFKLSDSWTAQSGYTLSDIPDISRWVHYAYEDHFPQMGEKLQGLEDLDFTQLDGAYWIRTKAGEKRLWQFHAAHIGETLDGRQVHECVAIDITEKERLAQRSKQDGDLLKTILESVGDGVMTCDARGDVVFMNHMAEQLTGWKEKNGKGKPLNAVFQIVEEISGDPVRDLYQRVKNRNEPSEPVNPTLLIRLDGRESPVEYSIAPLCGKKGVFEGAVLIFRDYTDKREQMNQAEFMGYHDNLTNLYNRRFLEEEMQRLELSRSLPFSIIMGDVNGLKLMNDVFGHQAGDQLLIQVASVLRDNCRNDEIIARMGGDEFVILLPGTDIADATHIVDRIKEQLQEKKINQLEISVAFGIGVKREEAESLAQALMAAEEEMYKKKLFESPEIKEKALERIIMMYHTMNQREGVRVEQLMQLCDTLGRALGFSVEKLETLRQAGFLHDIGKVAIEEESFIKEGKLSPQEWQNIQRHCEIGYRILSTVGEFANMAEYVLYHHEKWDGNGYPKGLKGKEIPLESRILSIVDSYEAMTSPRPYRETLKDEDALAELEKNAGTQFDPELIKLFVEKWKKASDD